MRASAVLLACILSGCSGDTSLLLDLSLASGVPQPDHLRVSVFGQALVGSPAAVDLTAAGRMLPGRLVVQKLDAALANPRLLVDGLDAGGRVMAQAAAHVQLSAGRQVTLALTLDAPLADSDGDGVPDAIDDCPQLADPDQRCGAPPPGDGGGVSPDLRGTDGAPTVFSCPSFATFCDDFESGDSGKWGGTFAQTNTTIGVDSEKAHSGMFALDAQAMVNGGSTAAGLDHTIIPTGTTIAARFYVRTPAFPGAYTLFMGLFANAAGWAVGVDGSGHWVITEDQGAQPDLKSTVAMPYDQWVCVEFQSDPPAPGDPKGRIRLWVDGTSVIDLPPSTYTFPAVLEVGLVRAPGTLASQVFVDDVVLAPQRIGCQ